MPILFFYMLLELVVLSIEAPALHYLVPRSAVGGNSPTDKPSRKARGTHQGLSFATVSS